MIVCIIDLRKIVYKLLGVIIYSSVISHIKVLRSNEDYIPNSHFEDFYLLLFLSLRFSIICQKEKM